MKAGDSMTGREYIEAHMDEVIQMAKACISRIVLPRRSKLPDFVKDDVLADEEDMLWGAVERIWEQGDYFDPGRARLSTWVYKTTEQYCSSRVMAYLLMPKRVPPLGGTAALDQYLEIHGEVKPERLADTVPSGEDIEQDYVDREQIAEMYEKLGRIPDERAKAIIMQADGEGRKVADMAAELGITRQRIRQIRDRYLKGIQREFELEDQYEIRIGDYWYVGNDASRHKVLLDEGADSGGD